MRTGEFIVVIGGPYGIGDGEPTGHTDISDMGHAKDALDVGLKGLKGNFGSKEGAGVAEGVFGPTEGFLKGEEVDG